MVSTAPSTTIATPRGTGDASVFEVGEAINHPNGMQLRVERVEVFSDVIVVVCGVTNGSRFGVRLDQGRTELRTTDGATAPLAAPPSVTRLGAGEDTIIVYSFLPLPADEFILAVNVGGGSSPVSPTTSSPSFEVGPFTLDPDRSRPQLPEAVTLDRSVVHTNGTELQVRGLAFTSNRIGIQIRAANPGRAGIVLAARTIAPSLVVDDLGNQYPIMVDTDEGSLTVPAGSARAGMLSFAGRIHPDASSLTLLLNQRSDPSTEGRGARYPRFRVEAMPISGEIPVPLPDPITAMEELVHPNGVSVTPRALRFGAASIELDVTISNPLATSIFLAESPASVIDDAQNRYPLLAPPQSPQLEVERGSVVEATFVFSGRIAPDAAEVTVYLNRGGSSEDPSTTSPAFVFGPYGLTRPAQVGTPPDPDLFVVSATSRLFDDTLIASDLEQISQTLTEFNATRTSEGVQLTLPDDILFDFGSAELRDDARRTLGLIAEVLEYFEGDEVVVIGHTDSIGSASFNQRLSEDRAAAVVSALVDDHGVDPGRLRAEGRGATEPVAPNTTPEGEDDPEGRQKNRRVEILVITDRPLPGD